MIKFRKFLLFLPLLLTFSGCSIGSGEVEDEPLRSTRWQLVDFTGHGDAVAESESRITFDDDASFNGRAACNSFYGTYEVDEGASSITLNVKYITEVGCELNSYEQALLNALENARRYSIDGKDLILHLDQNQRLSFVSAINYVWIGKSFSGGRQCNPHEEYNPPDVEDILEDAGIEVFDTEVEQMGVCAACSCPDYAAIQYALIDEDQLSDAEELGFERQSPPAYD